MAYFSGSAHLIQLSESLIVIQSSSKPALCCELNLYDFDRNDSLFNMSLLKLARSKTDQFNANSDIDLLLVVKDGSDLIALNRELYSRRWSKISLDFIFKTESEFNRRKELGGVCFVAFNEGKLIYDSPAN